MKLFHLLHTGPDCFLRLCPGHGRPFRHVSGSPAGMPVHSARHRFQHAHVYSQHVRMSLCCHQVDVPGSFSDRFSHQCRYAAVRLADALPDHSVIPAENQRAPVVDTHVFRSLDARDPDNQILQESQGMQRLCHTVPAPAGFFLYVHRFSPSIIRTTSLISSNRAVTFA